MSALEERYSLICKMINCINTKEKDKLLEFTEYLYNYVKGISDDEDELFKTLVKVGGGLQDSPNIDLPEKKRLLIVALMGGRTYIDAQDCLQEQQAIFEEMWEIEAEAEANATIWDDETIPE